MAADLSDHLAPVLPARKRGRPSVAVQAQLHQHIRNAAFRIFIEKGYGNTTIQQICAESEVSAATFYRYFRGKEEIFISAIRSFNDAETHNISSISDMPLEEGLILAANAHLDFVSDVRTQEVLRLIYAEAPRFPELPREFLNGTASWLKMLMFYLQQNRPGLSKAKAYDLVVMFMDMIGARLEHEHLLCVPTITTEAKRQRLKMAVDVFLRGFGAFEQTSR